ncbi:MAG TPA: helix-turn-helix domain-containing protein [Thermoleophilia bacterium]|nr:helix-turn-helix domain-containing protein [Thermoleophilia bacterium]
MNTEIKCRTYSVREAAQILGISSSYAYLVIERGEIPALRVGGRILVPRDALDEMLENPSMTRGFSTPRFKP